MEWCVDENLRKLDEWVIGELMKVMGGLASGDELQLFSLARQQWREGRAWRRHRAMERRDEDEWDKKVGMSHPVDDLFKRDILGKIWVKSLVS